KLKREAELIQAGHLDSKLEELWEDIQLKRKQEEEEAELKRKNTDAAYQDKMLFVSCRCRSSQIGESDGSPGNVAGPHDSQLHSSCQPLSQATGFTACKSGVALSAAVDVMAPSAQADSAEDKVAELSEEDVDTSYMGDELDLKTVGDIIAIIEDKRDIMLMFQNAVMYNGLDHDVYHMALEMQRDVLEQIQQFLATQLIMETSESGISAKSLRGRDSTRRQDSTDKVLH
ncbi:hypothetical protein XENOCAPTIV_000652, partial [Xenoophorus captivus]